ncbi:MAG: hypothetical protein ACE5JU_01490 [Candidatus Binatia bacterium]
MKKLDTLSHGLWGGVGFYPRGNKTFAAAFVLGMVPDLLSFGLFHVTRPDWISQRLLGKISGPPPIAILPDFVFYTYNLTHSLVIWSVLFALIWALSKHRPWVFLAWGLHILCDIPTHTSAYFPTPYLWPFPTPYFEGISWATRWFMLTNYTALLVVYIGLFAYRRIPPAHPRH